MTLEYVEDYIEFLYGSMDKEGTVLPVRSYYTPPNPIKLASYDKSPITSMGSFCCNVRKNKLESCLTDRQLGLARKIIFKYKRQLANLGVVLPEHEDDLKTRHLVRKIDRSKTLQLDESEKVMVLRFPYDPKKISELHDYSSTSAGHVEWDNANKTWEFDLTEGNIIKILDLFKTEDLQIDNKLEPHVVDIIKSTKDDLPSIFIKDNFIHLRNCHPRVNEYLESKGFEADSIDKLPQIASHASAIGLQIDKSIVDHLNEKYGETITSIFVNRKVTLPSNNQADGPWYDALLEANRILSDRPWALHLSWWSTKTDWKPFQNMLEFPCRNRTSFKIDHAIGEFLLNTEDPIVVIDSVVGRDAIRNFIENNSLKVVYISDIGNPP